MTETDLNYMEISESQYVSRVLRWTYYHEVHHDGYNIDLW